MLLPLDGRGLMVNQGLVGLAKVLIAKPVTPIGA